VLPSSGGVNHLSPLNSTYRRPANQPQTVAERNPVAANFAAAFIHARVIDPKTGKAVCKTFKPGEKIQ
jgi:hypothetical protein